MSIDAAKAAINAALRSRGGNYSDYSCKVVSWDDVQRGTTGGALSAFGPNITDTYLKAKDGTQLFTVRPDNWNEKLGMVTAHELAVVCNPEGGPVEGAVLEPKTLADLLDGLAKHGGYAGLEKGLFDRKLDSKVSIRFQTTFLPVDGARGTMQFAPEASNYQTHDDSDPRNLVLLCTTQGVAVQQDGRGKQRLYHHVARGHTGAFSGAVRHWLEAERTDHSVGKAQNESAAERADALARGKAVSSVIGIKALGTRFNVLMSVQVPLKQKARAAGGGLFGGGKKGGKGGGAAPLLLGSFGTAFGAPADAFAWDLPAADSGLNFGSEDEDAEGEEAVDDWGAPAALVGGGSFGAAPACGAPAAAGGVLFEGLPAASGGGLKRSRGGGARKSKSRARRGTANAARVSRGSKHDEWDGLTVKDPARHPSEHLTVTIVVYNTISGGVPTEADVVAAVDDLEALYNACDPGRLGSAKFDFMKSEMGVANHGPGVANHATFPASRAVEVALPHVPPPPARPHDSAPWNFGEPLPGVSPAVAAALANLGHPSDATFKYVHDKLGLPHLEHGTAHGDLSSLRAATQLFELANGISYKVHGKPSGFALYNLACCHSILSGVDEAQLAAASHLEKAATFLLAAAAAGYNDAAHMKTDPDLAALRASAHAAKVVMAWQLALSLNDAPQQPT